MFAGRGFDPAAFAYFGALFFVRELSLIGHGYARQICSRKGKRADHFRRRNGKIAQSAARKRVRADRLRLRQIRIRQFCR